MIRRTFLQAATGSLLAAPYALADTKVTNKRERMLQWLAGKTDPNYTPAAFFLHFAPDFKVGSAAAKRHLEFFHQTNMDFVKVQFEQTYQRQPNLEKPADWAHLKLQKIDFYEAQLQTLRELVASTKKEALVLMTLYSPFMCAGHCAGGVSVLRKHLAQDPDAVKKGLDILTESQLIFVRACIKAGVDGFYMSTQGAEANQGNAPNIFADYIKPSDFVAMKEVSKACPLNILHVCDYVAPYDSFEAVRDYPGQVVNCNPKLLGKQLTWQEITSIFKRPLMGGLDRHGLLASGTLQQVDDEIRKTIKSAPKQFILGADCTVEGNTDWTRLRHAIDTAHRVGVSA